MIATSLRTRQESSVLEQSLRSNSVGSAQNGIFCRYGKFWRMRGEVQQPGIEAPGHARHESGLRDRRILNSFMADTHFG